MKNHNTYILKYLKFDQVLKCAKELDELSNVKDKVQRKLLIKNAENCVIDAISEIAKNCLAGNIPLKSCDFKKLSKYQKLLRQISRKSSNTKRRKTIEQSGGFLNLLIPPALTLIASVVSDVISKKIQKSK